MLEKPALPDQRLMNCLQLEFGLQVKELSFLPLGADVNTAVYRAQSTQNAAFFVKLRKSDFSPASVSVPHYLNKQGLQQVIAPLTTKTGALWAELAPYKVILYPFVAGQHAYKNKLSAQQWATFGSALKQLHLANIPAEITKAIPSENFSAHWRNTLKMFLQRAEAETFQDPIAAQLAEFLISKKDETLKLINQAEDFVQQLQTQAPEFILCHADIHGWNLLINGDGQLFMVDWDTLIFAPKERDLMFIGGGLGNSSYTPQEEEALFYQGYGKTEINPTAIAYYRFKRILEDIAAYCEELFLSDAGGADRIEALQNVKANFLPNGTIEMAYQTHQQLKAKKNVSIN